MPKQGKYRAEGFAKGKFPCACTQKKGGGVAKAQIALAHPKAQIQPEPPQSQQKQAVAQKLRPQRAQKAVVYPRKTAQQQSGRQMLGGGEGAGHPNSRCQRPALLRGSS